MSTQQYKIVLLGSGGCGKTAFIHRHIHNNFIKPYIATCETEIYFIPFNTNYGSIEVEVSDTPGQLRNEGIYNKYIDNKNMAIIFYSIDSTLSAKDVKFWKKNVIGTSDIPIQIVGTKTNLHNKVTIADSMFINSKTGEGINELWREILSKVTGYEDIAIV